MISTKGGIKIPNVDSCIGICLLSQSDKVCAHLVITPNESEDVKNRNKTNLEKNTPDYKLFYIGEKGRTSGKYQLFDSKATDITVLQTLEDTFTQTFNGEEPKQVLLFGSYKELWGAVIGKRPDASVSDTEAKDYLSRFYGLTKDNVTLNYSGRSTNYKVTSTGKLEIN